MVTSMGDMKFVHVYSVSGQLQGQMIRIFLESQGISACVEEESAGTVFGMGVGPMAEAKIMVPEAQADQALEVLAALDRGEYELPSEEGKSSEEENGSRQGAEDGPAEA
jgi:hypothetical protein